MNKKGKHKKGKVPNPNPSQEEKSGNNVEELGKSDDKCEDLGVIGDKKKEEGIIGENIKNLEEKVESDKEERVPEIVSDIITPVDTKDEETPKKPKRNKGKKKKGKDEEFDDNIDVKPRDIDMQQSLDETKIGILEVENQPGELPPITPTARKKKNKKKNTDQKFEESTISDQNIQIIPAETEVSAKEFEEHDVIQNVMKTDISEQEVKPSKKKKNKKKRNDSEKSDKEELSCTAAFQKILDVKDEPGDIEVEEKVEVNIISLECIKTEVDKADKKESPIEPVIEKAQRPIKDEQESKETPITEGKGKKKNKKDKKNVTKPEESLKLDDTKFEQSPTLIEIDTSVQEPIPEQVPSIPEEVTKSIEEVSKDITTIESPKPKAKIAKPVEKKRKGKHEGQTCESTQHDINISEPIKVPEEPFQFKVESQSKDKVSEVESEISKPKILSNVTFIASDIPDEEEKLFAQEFELIAEKAMGKKRKKDAKMPKTLEFGGGTQEQVLGTDTKPTDIKEDIKTEQLPVITEILTPQIEQQEFIIMCEKPDIPTKIDTVTELKDTIKPLEITQFQGKELLTPENIVEEREFTTAISTTVQYAEDKQKTETKSGKKRKKSPKPPKKSEVEQIKERSITPKPEEVAKETSKAEEISKQSLSEKIDASNITRMYDIEISSIKADESEGSACDVTPDITYPRAVSQQLPDDNNNTVIREIFPVVEPIKDNYLIQRCTEISKKEEIAIASKEEKTDIKSKMMEVNQDMEELRLSIERSLAELTSMEKSEDVIEKEFEATRAKAEKISNILFDTDESSAIQKPHDKEKLIEKTDIKEVTISTPSLDIEPTQVIEGNKPKVEEKSKASKSKKGKTISDTHNKNTDEKKIKSPNVESHIADVPFKIDAKAIEPPIKIDNKTIVIPPADKILSDKPLTDEPKVIESSILPIPLPAVEEKKPELLETEKKDLGKPKEQITETPIDVPPVCPARKDNKSKNKKKKGKQETQTATTTQSTPTTTQSQSTQESKKEAKTESKTETKSDSKDKGESKNKGKQQSSNVDSLNQVESFSDVDYEPIENFEDALTSSADDVNKTFEMIVKESQEQNNPKINIIAPDDEKTQVSPPKNLLGHPDIPVRSNRRDYKKEKDKIPNEITARVKIKDSVEVERKQSKNTQTTNKMKDFSKDYKINDSEDFVYKYSFRKVFLQSACHVCKKNLSGCRVPCSFCNLLFYCSNKHKDEDWPHHQALCFAVSTLGHLKDQKHIYADAKNLTGHDYRLIRMQMIVSCEKVLKRRLVPWEQEALLYPRICAHVPCREWRQGKLSDCQGCGQISFCTDKADHLPQSHSRWCKSYSLYEKLVCYQQTKGRLEPKLPTKVLQQLLPLPEKINEVLASMYEEKIDISDIQYAALTQLATAPLTAAYCHQICRNKASTPANGVLNKKSSFTIHVVGAELQFEADALNKWEVFFLHLRPDLQELRVVLINYNLNPSNLPLELLGKVKFCDNCRQNKRRVVFDFQDKRTYTDYKSCVDFVHPDIVCAFNPSIQRSSVYNGKDPWPTTVNIILKLKIPFIITAYTITELHKDCIRIKECSEAGYNFITEPMYNNFASVRPDRNFISDDEMPLLFKNYCFTIISG